MNLWWEVHIDMISDYLDLRYLAALYFPDSEIGNYGCIGEQLWYEIQTNKDLTEKN